MTTRHLPRRALALVAGIAMLAFGGWAAADPPSRVARMGYMTGSISFSPAGEGDWMVATLNRPLTSGDRLWAEPGSRAEIEIGGAMVRIGADSGVSILNLDDHVAQLQLTQGTLNVRVRRLERDQLFEVATPNLAFTMRQPGEFRIHVNPDDNTTTIVVRRGQGEAYGEGAAYLIDSRHPYRFAGTALRDYRELEAVRLDEFDRWSSERDRRYETSVSLRYVSPDVIGYHDLDEHGTWRTDASYGNVWYPNRVSADWAPYHDGNWTWIDPWGWTWVDDAPWGFAVSHYGRWANMHGRWGWVPGPVRSRAYYAPALVAFIGGANFQLTISTGSVGGVGWFPLAPREVYRPSYAVSRGYFENVNRSNTVVTNTVINNYYNNSSVTQVTYMNQQVPGAVIAVPATAFVQSQPVSRAAVRMSAASIAGVAVAVAPSVAPTEWSVRGAAAQGGKPPERVFQRPVIARSAPAAAPLGFSAQQQQLGARAGKPLDAEARRQLQPSAGAAAPVVNVIAPTQAAPAAIPRSAAAPPAARRDDARGKPQQPEKAQARAQPAAPQPAPSAPATRAQPATPPATAQAPKGKSEEPRGKPEARESRAQPAPAQPAPSAPQARAQPAAPAIAQRPATPAPDARQAAPKGEPRAQETGPPAGKGRNKENENEKEKEKDKPDGAARSQKN